MVSWVVGDQRLETPLPLDEGKRRADNHGEKRGTHIFKRAMDEWWREVAR